MIVMQCARGLVFFRNLGVDVRRVQRFYCMNDDRTFQVPYGPAKATLTGLQALVAHAVQLNGALTTINDLAEVQ